jgi:hypothetical protein
MATGSPLTLDRPSAAVLTVIAEYVVWEVGPDEGGPLGEMGVCLAP